METWQTRKQKSCRKTGALVLAIHLLNQSIKLIPSDRYVVNMSYFLLEGLKTVPSFCIS